MKKQILGILLVLCIMSTILPSTAFVANGEAKPPANTSESEPVLLGTEAEYASALETMFDANGLRKVAIGFTSNGGTLNKKVGLVNKYGNFVVQPIYDEIELHVTDDRQESDGVTTLPFYFVGGYTQAVRDGKMGLLNTNGEEVIPCQYDFVQMPSEGMCAVYQKISEDKHYLGYWNLEQNREVLAPNKYITDYVGVAIGAHSGASMGYAGQKKATGDYFSFHDFIDGRALVPIDGTTSAEFYVNIVDKDGNEVLQQNYCINGRNFSKCTFSYYPQKGGYLAFIEPISFAGYQFTKLYNEWDGMMSDLTVNSGFATGLVGAEGVLIPATYTTGVLADGGEFNFFINSATFQIILDKGLILTLKDAKPGFLYGGAYGVIDFHGNTVLPFTHSVNQELYYSKNENVFTGYTSTLYNIKGEKLNDYLLGQVHNGYIMSTKLGEYNKERGNYQRNHCVVRADGAELDVTSALGLDPFISTFNSSHVSTGGCVWVQNGAGKWGLLDFSGNTVLPFEYDEVQHMTWANTNNGFACVIKNGKMGMVNAQGKLVLPCDYKRINNPNGDADVVIIENEHGFGMAEISTGKIIIPTEYSKLGCYANHKQKNRNLFDMGVCYGEKDGKNLLIDLAGNVVFSTTKKFSEAIDGLYSFNDGSGQFDNRGRIIFPKQIWQMENLEIGNSFTIYIEGGNVYRISANYIDSTYGFKPYAPQNTMASPSSTNLVVNGKNIATDAYSIGGYNYIKLRDIATMVNNTDKNFDVTWDGAKNAINLLSSKAYTAVGNEMAMGDGQSKPAIRTDSKVFVDGAEVALTAYNIQNNNYFKLRDVMQIFDVAVGFDNATSTATLTTNEGYALAAYEQGKLDEYAKAYEQASGNPYVQKPKYKEETIKFVSVPNKILYNVGEPFEIAGFKVTLLDIYGVGTDITGEVALKVDSTKIHDGYKFQSAGEKTVDCYYKDKKLNSFKISVIKEDNKLVKTGAYYMKIYGKYIVPVKASGGSYLELSDKKPELPFDVKLIKVDDKRGPLYTIMYDKAYIISALAKNGAQLQFSSIPQQWRINKYTDFCTIRDYGNQKLIVNAAGQKSDNGTKVIVWSDTGKAESNAKIVFTKAD